MPPAPRAPAETLRTAQEIADAAQTASSRDEVRALIKEAKAARCLEDSVCVRDVWMDLKTALTDAWNATAGGEPE
jgi:hypothetical protein